MADTVSVMVYTNGDNSWQVKDESGFSCHMLSTFHCTKCPRRSTGHSIEAGCTCDKGTKGQIVPASGGKYSGSCKLCGKNYGFNADASSNTNSGKGWQEVDDWRTSGTKNSELYNVGPGFDQVHGRYVAPVEGYYLCSTNLRLDNVASSSFTRLVVAVNGADQKCAPACTSTSGFNADLQSSILQAGQSNKWRELINWNLRGVSGLYESDSEFKNDKGRFYPNNDGYYLCSANIRLDSFSGSKTRLTIEINGQQDKMGEGNAHNGLSVIWGDGRSTNYYSMHVSGNIFIKKGQYASVFLYSLGDNSFYIQHTSGFSCHKFESKIGFRADMTKKVNMGNGVWKEMASWRVSGEPGLYSVGSLGTTAGKQKPLSKLGKDSAKKDGKPVTTTATKKPKLVGFDTKAGRYYVPKPGVYFCSAHFRLDGANVRGNFRLSIRHEGQESSNQLFVMSGNYFSSNHGTLQVASTIKIDSYVSAWLHSSSDSQWTVNDESGFGCHYMPGKYGFHATPKITQNYGRHWQIIKNWVTDGSEQSYASDPFTNGQTWTVPFTAYYYCSISVIFNNHHSGYYNHMMLSIDGSTNQEHGMSSISGNRGSTNTKFMTVAGVVRLEREQTVAVRIYSNGDNSYAFNADSSFSCHMMGQAKSNVLADFEEKINNGFAVIDGNGGGSNKRNIGASGVLKLKKNDVASVFVYTHTDNSWTLNGESGFSCHKLSSDVGFHADKDGDTPLKQNWQEVPKWRVAGFPTLYSSGGFDPSLGRFKVLNEGVYYCYAQVRLDDAARNMKRLIMARNQDTDTNNGFHTIQGNFGGSDYRSMRIAGNAYVKKGDTVSLFVYSSSDSYTAQSESGFGCHQLTSKTGFHADMSKDQLFGRGWRRVSNWQSGGNEFLYSMSGGFSADGYYSAPQDGYYICSSVMRVDSVSTSSGIRLLITINDNQDHNNGLHAFNSYGSSDYRPLAVAGSVYLKAQQKVAVWMYSESDNSWYARGESGFGCHLLETYTDCK